MKKLFLCLLTAATAATAVAGIAGCTDGQTGGGDNNTQTQADLAQAENPAPPFDQAEGEFEFMPPQLPSGVSQSPLPPPSGRIFNHTGRNPEFLRDMSAGGNVKEGSPAAENRPSGKIRKKKDKRPDDIVTPDGGISPDKKNTEEIPEKHSCPDCEEKNTEDSTQNSGEKQDKRQKSGNTNRKKFKKHNNVAFG
ncbi:MAG: hypothetical protein LUD27_06400 [Clostridia bacterium]|nr:hypothetical protein [Clostridia bacterium]